MRKLIPGAVSVLFGLALTACASTPIVAVDITQRRINVVSTVGMITDIVRNVGGERVLARGLMGPGVDPHLYKPSAGDAIRLGNADIIFYGGLHLEGRMAELFEKIELTGKPAVAVSRDIEPVRLRQPPEFEGKYDPHIWFDVSLWQSATRTVAAALTSLDPNSAALYAANARAYLARLETLDQYARAQIATIPAAQRVMITAHDAFGYFGQAYGMEVRGLQGISTASEISAADVQSLSEFITARKIKALFVESSVPESTVRAVQEAVRSRGHEVVIGGELFSDAMGAEGTPEGTYIGMVTFNVDTIVRALR
ncbi:MAG: zinc ABC transporter substrate-binding protein [Thermoflexales bacterium]|nr:zinc ABC transporter substrate-binding protein [Thermoflexales bacterium]MBP8241501.1 zinc ABC transporter substrate-binding protein [Thermoflexales bacterium]